jgi:hypothetical protein
MTTEELLRSYIEDGQPAAELERMLDSATERQALYRLLFKKQPRLYRRLLLRLLDKEISFRTATGEGSVAGDEESAEGIFHCAYLLSRCGEPADALEIWKAQYLNQDVGELEVGFFVGAGVAPTLAFLAGADDETSQEVREYIRSSLSDPDASRWLEAWEASRYAALARNS